MTVETLLLIGRTTGQEDFVTLCTRQARVVRFCQTLDECLDCDHSASLIVILQHWPDEFPRHSVQAFLANYPVSRLMVCLDAWCASYGRTRGDWPPAVCVFPELWASRLQKEVLILAGKLPPLPWTAGLDEIFAFDQLPIPSDG
jgi:hypothetical protein